MTFLIKKEAQKVFAVYLILIAIVVGVVSYIYSRNVNPPLSVDSSGLWENKGTASSSFDLKGKIFLSLRPNVFGSSIGIYKFDAANRQLQNFLIGFWNNSAPHFSDNGQKIVFASNKINDEVPQIFIADADGENIKQVTSSQVNKKQLPVFSPDGEIIAFTVFPLDSKTFLPEEQKVYIVDLNGNERFLTNGAYSLFSPDGKSLLVLKNDGLHLVDVLNGVSSRVIKSESTFITMKLALSKNRNMLVWTNFPNEVLVFKLNWNPFNYFLYKKISIGAFWPVFSPDSRYLALQEAKGGKFGTSPTPPTNGRIVVYDLETLEWEELIDLHAYKQTHMWMTDWQP